MKVYRVADKRYSSLEGLGGVLFPGRWNEKGHRIVYVAETRSLAAWEKLMHISKIDFIPDDLVMVEIEVANVKIETVPGAILVPGWKNYPHIQQTIRFGTEFLKSNRALMLKVPSAVIEGEFNYILNPNFPDFDNLCKILTIEPFKFDERLKSM